MLEKRENIYIETRINLIAELGHSLTMQLHQLVRRWLRQSLHLGRRHLLLAALAAPMTELRIGRH